VSFNPSISILVVDDHQVMRKTIAYILRQVGFNNLHFAEDGETAWQFITKGPVDLLLLDWNMPRMSGLELLERIRRSEEYNKLPVLMITAEATDDQVLTAINAGVTDYVVKPFTPETLLKKLRDSFERTGSLKRPAKRP
jgi:two-component system, chemotaxis family, chemotaxis protein CheY